LLVSLGTQQGTADEQYLALCSSLSQTITKIRAFVIQSILLRENDGVEITADSAQALGLKKEEHGLQRPTLSMVDMLAGVRVGSERSFISKYRNH
jgi:hypothetical protein